MNGLAIIVGYTVIWLFVALIIVTPVGKFIGRKRKYTLEVEDWDPAPRPTTAPHVPRPWQLSDDDLRDRTPHEPAP